MADLDINALIILITLFVIFGVFLLFDLFKRNEKYGYLAYIIALVPVNYLWYLTSTIGIGELDVLGAYVVLIVLWDICLFRDLIGVSKEKKDFDDVILFLGLGIIIQLIISAILPADQLNPDMLVNTEPFVNYFNLPNIHNEIFNDNIVLAYKALATLMVFLVIVPLILDIKDEEVPFIVIIIIMAIFILPFLYLSYLWLPDASAVLTFLFSVILFIVLLMITRSGKE